MKFARYLEEQSVPEWKRAYINYRGMKKLIKRVQQRREKRLSLDLERRTSKASSSAITRSGTGFSVASIRRRGASFRRNTGDLSEDTGISGNDQESHPNYKTFNSFSNETTGGDAHRVQFQSGGPQGPREDDDLPKVSLNGTGLRLLSEDQFGSKEQDKSEKRRASIPNILSNLSSKIDPSRRSTSSASANVEPSDVETGINRPSTSSNLPRSSGTWNSQTPTAAGLKEEDTDNGTIGLNSESAKTSARSRNPIWQSSEENSTDLDSDETNVASTSMNHNQKHLVKTSSTDVSDARDESAAAAVSLPPSSPEIEIQKQAQSSGEGGENQGQAQAQGKENPKGKGQGGGGKKKKGGKAQTTLQQLIYDNFDEEESRFFSASDAELERILEFYEQREKEMKDRFTVLARQLKELAEHRREYKAKHPAEDNGGSNLFSGLRIIHASHQPALSSSSPETPAQSLQAIRSSIDKTRSSLDRSEDEGDRRRSLALAKVLKTNKANLTFEELKEENERAKAIAHDPERYKNARKKLKAALVEYYRTLELLKNFKILNRTGFQKCMKKLEKTVMVNGISEAYYKEKVASTPLAKSDKIEKLIKATEDIFTAYFEHGNRKHALERLRAGSMGPIGEQTTHHFSVFRTGLYLGIALCATIAGIVQTQYPNTYLEIPNHERLLRVYGALFLPAIFALLFGLNLAAWHRARINTIFIFEWDVRHAIDYRTYFEMPAFFLLLLSLCFWVSFLNPFPSSIAPTSWPLVWIVVVLLILLNPIPITIPQSRTWFVTSIARVFQAGILHGVEFRDFFLGDELNSLAWSISNLWLIGCEYDREWKFPDSCDPNGTFWTAALMSIPAFLRLIQCFRRFKDSGNTAYLHLVNAGKYSSAILYYWFYHNFRYHGSGRSQDFALWMVFAVIYSCYTSSWDILMDWSLLQRHCRYPFLRNELVFESVWPVYYLAIVSNVILRFSWTVYLIPGPASMTLKIFLVALLEVLRRFQWNFFRLENEHLGNVDQYRVSKDVPLPYKLTNQNQDLDDDDDEEDEDEEQVQKSIQKSKNPFERFKLQRRKSLKHEREELDAVRQQQVFDKDLASSDNDSHHQGEDSNPDPVEFSPQGRDPQDSGLAGGESKKEPGSTGRLKAKIRENLNPILAPDADVNERIDKSGAARGLVGKDYVRKVDEESDSDE